LVCAKLITQQAVEIRVLRHFSFYSVARGLGDLLKESLDVLQIGNALDTEDDEPVPPALVTIPEVTPNAAPKVLCETHVVELIALIQGVDTCVPSHEFLEALFEQRAVEKVA